MVKTINIFYDKIIVIESLLDNDRRTGKDLFDDCLSPLCENTPEIEPEYHYVHDIAELTSLLDRIRDERTNPECSLILHFELHGDEKGVCLESGEYYPYHELVNKIAEINYKVANGLLVMMVACKGAYLIKSCNFTERSPFMLLVGPKDETDPSEIGRVIIEFYISLIRDRDLAKAKKLLKTCEDDANFIMISTEGLLYDAFEVYQSQGIDIEGCYKRLLVECRKSGKTPPCYEIYKRQMEDEEWFFEEVKKTFLLIDEYPDVEHRFEYSYQDYLRSRQT